MEKRPNRRDFLKIGGTAIGSAFLASCDSSTPIKIIKKITGIPPTPSNTAIPSPIDTAPPSENKDTPNPPEKWKIPNLEERISLLANPDFFTKPLDTSGRIILTPQFDLNQYTRLEDQYRPHLNTAHYKENSCGSAVIATILKTFTYFKTGEVPDITIGDVLNELMNKTYDIQPNSTLMRDKTLELALGHYAEKSGLFHLVTGLTPYWGLEKSHLIPGNQWKGIFINAQEKVLDKGGVLTAFVVKYGIIHGSAGHFVIFSSLAGSTKPLIVDSIGPLIDGERKGSAQVMDLGAYCEDNGFLGMMGVVPNF